MFSILNHKNSSSSVSWKITYAWARLQYGKKILLNDPELHAWTDFNIFPFHFFLIPLLWSFLNYIRCRNKTKLETTKGGSFWEIWIFYACTGQQKAAADSTELTQIESIAIVRQHFGLTCVGCKRRKSVNLQLTFVVCASKWDIILDIKQHFKFSNEIDIISATLRWT